MKEGFTKIPNRMIRSRRLDPYEKIVLICIMSYNPSYPGYDALQIDCGISRERLWKSLRKLEQLNLIQRYKQEKKIIYLHYWNDQSLSENAEPIKFRDHAAKPTPNAELRAVTTSSPGELKPVRQANSKKNKEKDLLASKHLRQKKMQNQSRCARSDQKFSEIAEILRDFIPGENPH